MKWTLFPRRREPIDDVSWSRALSHCAYARALNAADHARLRALVERFVDTKSFEGAAGFELTPPALNLIALKACVPILNLGIDYYAGWRDIIVYPADFRVDEEYTDSIGIVHRGTRDLCGQSLSQGPIVLSWQAITDTRGAPERDVVIHECAHKLDILNGAANGFPPLHAPMSAQRWARVFREAYVRFVDAVHRGDTALDTYAATDPAEFFAVMTETFFGGPAIVHDEFPAAYAELADFYRQDPFALCGGAT